VATTRIKKNPGELSRPAFWISLSLDELVAQHDVAPIADLRDLDAIWSDGDVFDDALSEVLEDRAQRRRRERPAN
jgi:hypothetical protein